MHEFWSVSAVHQSSSVKDTAIQVLGTTWPLTLKQVSDAVAKQTGKTVSQQAVFKALQELVNEKIVEKTDKQYALNREWITYWQKTVNQLAQTYENQVGKIDIPKDSRAKTVVKINDPNAVAVTVAKLVASRILCDKKPEPFYGIKRHGLWTLRFSFADIDLLREMTTSVPCYCAVIGDTPFDQWVVNQYNLHGFKKSKTGCDTQIDEFDLTCQGEYVMKIEYSKETLMAIEYLCQHITNISDLFELYSKQQLEKMPFEATLTIERNPDMARLIKEKVLRLLGEQEI